MILSLYQADWRALRGALVGCLALVKRKSGGMVTSNDAKGVAESFLQNLQVQSLGQHDRKVGFVCTCNSNSNSSRSYNSFLSGLTLHPGFSLQFFSNFFVKFQL